uniref:Uncharacterized protein n=1 Tax=Mycena chlorophos TaxID=658473 RepID=A0ABQ0M047_MYCCL|nr:predicted protein [Mycena chlorophos]
MSIASMLPSSMPAGDAEAENARQMRKPKFVSRCSMRRLRCPCCANPTVVPNAVQHAPKCEQATSASPDPPDSAPRRRRRVTGNYPTVDNPVEMASRLCPVATRSCLARCTARVEHSASTASSRCRRYRIQVADAFKLVRPPISPISMMMGY